MNSFRSTGFSHSSWRNEPLEVPTRDKTPDYKLIGHVGKTLVLRNKNELDTLSDVLVTLSFDMDTTSKEFKTLSESLGIIDRLAIQHTREKE